jgi:hypothetical protein
MSRVAWMVPKAVSRIVTENKGTEEEGGDSDDDDSDEDDSDEDDCDDDEDEEGSRKNGPKQKKRTFSEMVADNGKKHEQAKKKQQQGRNSNRRFEVDSEKGRQVLITYKSWLRVQKSGVSSLFQCQACLHASPGDRPKAAIVNGVTATRMDKLTEHSKDSTHKNNVLEFQKKAAKAAKSSAGVKDHFDGPDLLWKRTLGCFLIMTQKQWAVDSVKDLLETMQEAGLQVSYDHLGNGRNGWSNRILLAGYKVALRQLLGRGNNALMAGYFPQGMPFGFSGDGSNDRSQREQECLVIRQLNSQGRPEDVFLGLFELNLHDSEDHLSPDSLCIYKCYDKAFKMLEEGKAFDFNLREGKWSRALVGGSVDGASVMIGKHRGVAARMKEGSPWSVFLHATAHVTQLFVGDAFKAVPYVKEWRDTVQKVYIFYSQSGKKNFSLHEIAKELEIEGILKISGTHGIRWVAAQRRTLVALMIDLTAVIVDLEMTAKRDCGAAYGTMTPAGTFMGKSAMFVFEDLGQGRRYKGTITAVFEGATALRDTFTVYFQFDKKYVVYSREEIVLAFTDESRNGLSEHPAFVLMTELQQFRFVSFTYFMLDVHDTLSRMSKSFQARSGIISDIIDNLGFALADFDALKTICGPQERGFLAAVKEEDNSFGGTVLQNRQEAEAQNGPLQDDRRVLLESLSADSTRRFKEVLSDPTIKQLAIFDQRQWPPLDVAPVTALADFGNEELLSLCKDRFGQFFEDVDAEALTNQWKRLKKTIQSGGMRLKKFKDLWADAVVQYQDEYGYVLRMVVIMLLMPTDTSEAERIFSLMNNIKSKTRSTLGNDVLVSLMMWHYVWGSVERADFPYKAVLDQIRADASAEDISMYGHKLADSKTV